MYHKTTLLKPSKVQMTNIKKCHDSGRELLASDSFLRLMSGEQTPGMAENNTVNVLNYPRIKSVWFQIKDIGKISSMAFLIAKFDIEF